MLLADSEILKAVRNGTLNIKNFDSNNLNSNSYEISLSGEYKKYSEPNKRLSFKDKGVLDLQCSEIYYLESIEEFSSEKLAIIAFSTLGASYNGLNVMMGTGLTEIGYSGKLIIPVHTICVDNKIDIQSKIVKVCFMNKEGMVINRKYQNKKESESIRYKNRFVDSGIAGIQDEQ